MKNESFKFSIIMPIYKVEKYLEKAIKSVVNQSLDFKKNVQLILVNDGSPDNSKDICLKYKNKFPRNIIYIEKNNGGLSSARNAGLKQATGKLINFLDSDDIFSKNVLKEIWTFYLKYKIQICVLTIPLVMFEGERGLHPKYKEIPAKNQIINLEKNPEYFVSSSAATFYHRKSLKDKKFDENLTGSEDLKFNLMLFAENSNFGYVCERGVKYNYRQRKTKNSITDLASNSIHFYEGFFNLFSKYNKSDFKRLPYLSEIFLYELRPRIKQLMKSELNLKLKKDLLNRYKELFLIIDQASVFGNSKIIVTPTDKLLFVHLVEQKPLKLHIKNQGIFYGEHKLFSLKEFPVRIFFEELNEKKLTLHLGFSNFLKGVTTIKLRSSRGNYIEADNIITESTNFDEAYGYNLSKTKIFKFNLLLNEKESYSIIIDNDNNTFVTELLIPNKLSSLSLLSKSAPLSSETHSVFVWNNKIIIREKIKFKKLKSFLALLINKKEFVFSRFLKFKEKYILIMDRPNLAKDNGEALFKYIYSTNFENKKNVYFIISKKSVDYKRLKKIGKVVNPLSLKHKYLALNSKLIISSHANPNFYLPFNITKYPFYADNLKFKFIWLQHGVTMNDVSQAVNKYIKKIDKVIVSTKNEKKEFAKQKYFYNQDDVLLTGFPRFDALKNHPKKIITIAPTWRSYLGDTIYSDGSHSFEETFVTSKFYKEYSQLLNSSVIEKILENHGFVIYFVLHPGLNQYSKLFKSTKNIKILKAEKVDYSKLFAETQLLITDYSSVSFDFAYLNKPLIYFQFDKDEFFTFHYKRGYFSYEKNGFGDVLVSNKEVIEKIKYYIQNQFNVELKYKKRVANTFAYQDKSNCQRVFNEIKKIYYK